MDRQYTVKLTAQEIVLLYNTVEDSKMHQTDKGILLQKFSVEEVWDELNPADFGDDDWAKPDCMI